MPNRAFKWLPHDRSRHAVEHRSNPGEDTRTLCGVDVTVPTEELPRTHWYWPTCVDCDAAWRGHEGIPTFPRAWQARP